MVGQIFDPMPGPGDLDGDENLVRHRLGREKGEIFEVYKRFVPIRSKFMPGHMGRHGMPMVRHGQIREFLEMGTGGKDPNNKEPGNNAPNSTDQANTDWSRGYLQCRDGNLPHAPEHYIFAGLSMDREKYARDRLLRETVWRGGGFFVLGCVGMVALFAFQAYRSARASLTRVKAFSDTVIQNMPSGLVTINTQSEITSMNQAARDILARDPDRPFPEMAALIREMEMSKQGLNREINLAVSPDRKVRLDITTSIMVDTQNKVTGYLFLFRDLTQIKELKQQVETNRHLAAIGKLAAGVAHEIRNPLSSIKGFAVYFSKRYQDNASDRETAGIMVKEVERINRSITQLLEFAKPLAVEKRQVDILQMINHSIKLVQNDLEHKKIETRVSIDTKNPEIVTDGDRMNQVLLNLYINALAALEEGGTLEVLARDLPEQEAVEIRVKDNGPGIDASALELIFDPYYTTRPTGTGLGLSIVHRIVENLGGRIRVESEKGRGACFIITLPLS
jgi:two-component system sensor histidine kinase HydH